MQIQIVSLEESAIASIPVPQTEPLQTGTVFKFRGDVIREYRPNSSYDRILLAGVQDECPYAISASQLIHAKGNIRRFIRNYKTLGEALKALYGKPLIISSIEYEEKQLPVGPVTFKTLTIDFA